MTTSVELSVTSAQPLAQLPGASVGNRVAGKAGVRDIGVVRALPVRSGRAWRTIEDLEPRSSYAQEPLALVYQLPTGLGCQPGHEPHSPGRDAGSASPSWAALLVQAVVEVIACDRPLTQLIRWTSHGVYTEIARRRQYVARHRAVNGVLPARQQVASLRLSEPWPGCAEVTARITFGARSRAVAARLDRRGDRWVCTALEFG
jgi:hypothetical protein